MTSTDIDTGRDIGVGLISVGWMGKLHTRAYQALPSVYPELNLHPRLVHAADTAPDRAEYARHVLGYAKASSDYRDVLTDPGRRRRLHLRAHRTAPGDWRRRRRGGQGWNFERMNEVRVCIGRGGPHYGYTTALGNAQFGDYAYFQPGPGNSMGYDDLKVIEAKKFLVAVAGGERRNSTVDEAHHVAEVIAAAAASADSGTWQQVPAVPGAAFGHR
jgi:predicted dehydrogenase